MSTKSVSPVAKQLYRPDTGYGALWSIGSAKFHKDEPSLVQAVHDQTGKAKRKIEFDLAVLKSPGHSSNNDRSRLETNASGHIKLVAIHPENVAKPLPVAKKVKKTVVTKKAVTPAATAPASVPAVAPAAPAPTATPSTPAETPVASN